MNVATSILLSTMEETQLPLHKRVCTSPLVLVPIQVILVQEPKETSGKRHLCSSALYYSVKEQALKEKHHSQPSMHQ